MGAAEARQVDVVDIPPAAGEQPRILGPRHRIADIELAHARLSPRSGKFRVSISHPGGPRYYAAAN